MKLSSLLSAGLVGMTLCLGGCDFIADTPPEIRGAAVTVGKAEAGKTIGLPIGGTLEVRLASNATTGYGWRTEQVKGDSLVPVGRQPQYVPDQAPAGMVGSGGQDQFRFRAKKEGESALRFAYFGPGKRGKITDRVFYRVVVR